MTTNEQQTGENWWRTALIDMRPGEIKLRGYPVEQIIGRASFAEIVWLMLRGERPSVKQARLLEAALVAGVDHGPQAPSIATARMAITCGVGLNNAMASAVNVLGDVHGGAGEQAVALYQRLVERVGNGDYDGNAHSLLDELEAEGQRYLPGFGHRFHPLDPRAPRLLALVEEARRDGVVSGAYANAAGALERALEKRKGRLIPLNIDGATAVIYAELGFPAPVARGLFCLSRSVGILAHAWEQREQGGRNKGPIPRSWFWTYDGPAPRQWTDDAQEDG